MIRAALLLALALAVALPSSAARAQAPNPEASLAPPKLDVPALNRSYRGALARRNIGIGLAIPGVVLTVIGAVVVSYAATDPRPNLVSEGAEIVSGAIVSFVGLSLAVPGVVLWILGQDTMDVISWRKRQLTTVRLQPVVSPRPNGGTVGFALTF
jgi:hypothetical protein